MKEETRVVIKVYDLLGREIETLTNADHHPGVYSLTFTANSLASGLYFYAVEIQDYFGEAYKATRREGGVR